MILAFMRERVVLPRKVGWHGGESADKERGILCAAKFSQLDYGATGRLAWRAEPRLERRFCETFEVLSRIWRLAKLGIALAKVLLGPERSRMQSTLTMECADRDEFQSEFRAGGDGITHQPLAGG